MAKREIAFIVNPISGVLNKAVFTENIPRYLDRDAFDYQIVYTERAGHAAELAREFVTGGTDAVVAVGGDGTVNEIAGVLVHTGVAFGVMPCGSGNGLARHLRIPMDAAGAIRVLNRFQTKLLDYGKINDLPFFCTCGMGFDAFVSSKFAQSEKRGALTYLENMLREGLKYQPDTYEIMVEGDTVRHEAFLIACANASQYGNNALIAPHASMSDGLMDVTIMEPFTVLEAPQIALQLFNGTLPQNNKIKTLRCKKISIRRSRSGYIHCDGEPLTAGTEINVQLIEKGLRMIVNTQPSEENVIEQTVSLLYEELVAFGMDLHNRNIRKFEEINKEMKRRLGI